MKASGRAINRPIGKGALLALACGSCLVATAFAESVPIGRYAEVHVGVSHAHPYATSGGDAQRTGRSRAHAPMLAPKRLWSATLPQQRLVPPTVMADGTLIVGGALGICALEPTVGAQRWFAALGVVGFSPSVLPSGELVAIASGKLVVFTTAGAVRELPMPFALMGAPLVLDSGTVVAAGADGQLHAIAADGTQLTSVPTGMPAPFVRWTAWASRDLIAGAGPAPDVVLVSLESRSQRTVRLSEPIVASPVVGDQHAISLLGERGTLFSVTADARIRARIQLAQGGAAYGPVLGWDGALRVGLRYGEIACVTDTGQERWRRGLDGAPGPMSIDADDTLLFVSTRGTLYAIDKRGELRYRQALDVRGAGRPVLAADGTIYVVSRGGQIDAWR